MIVGVRPGGMPESKPKTSDARAPVRMIVPVLVIMPVFVVVAMGA